MPAERRELNRAINDFRTVKLELVRLRNKLQALQDDLPAFLHGPGQDTPGNRRILATTEAISELAAQYCDAVSRHRTCRQRLQEMGYGD